MSKSLSPGSRSGDIEAATQQEGIFFFRLQNMYLYFLSKLQAYLANEQKVFLKTLFVCNFRDFMYKQNNYG